MCQCSTVLSKRLNHQIFPFTLPVTSLVYRFVTYKKIASFCIAFLWPLSICPSYPPQSGSLTFSFVPCWTSCCSLHWYHTNKHLIHFPIFLSAHALPYCFLTIKCNPGRLHSPGPFKSIGCLHFFDGHHRRYVVNNVWRINNFHEYKKQQNNKDVVHLLLFHVFWKIAVYILRPMMDHQGDNKILKA